METDAVRRAGGRHHVMHTDQRVGSERRGSGRPLATQSVKWASASQRLRRRRALTML